MLMIDDSDDDDGDWWLCSENKKVS